MLYKIFNKNNEGNDYVIGDIHGHYTALMNLLKLVNFNFKKDRLFCVGDLTDRGNENIKVIKLLNEDWFFSVRGNHEDIIIDAGLKSHSEFYKDRYNRNGNEWFFEEDLNVRKEIISKFKSLPFAIQVGQIGIVHAYPDNCWKKTLDSIKYNDQLKISSYIWNRSISKLVSKGNNSLVRKIKNIDYVIVGHQIQAEAKIIENIVFLDTGYYSGNALSLISLNDMKIKRYEYNE